MAAPALVRTLHNLRPPHPRSPTATLHPPPGDKIKACVDAFPYLLLDATLQPITRSVLRIQLTLTPAFEWRVRAAARPGGHPERSALCEAGCSAAPAAPRSPIPLLRTQHPLPTPHPQEKAHGQALRWWVWVEDTESDHLYHSESWLLTKKMAR
jgi:activating signal cointegrator complex subunit 3